MSDPYSNAKQLLADDHSRDKMDNASLRVRIDSLLATIRTHEADNAALRISIAKVLRQRDEVNKINRELTANIAASAALAEAVRQALDSDDEMFVKIADARAILATAPRSTVGARLTELEARTKGQVKYGGVLSGTSPRSASEETLERVRDVVTRWQLSGEPMLAVAADELAAILDGAAK